MRTFSFNVFLTRAPDVDGQCVGHCLEVDVVSQGNSLCQAYEMTREAVEMVVLDDLNAGREPTARAAPREEFEAAYRALQSQERKPQLYTLTELFEREHELQAGAIAPLVLTFVKPAATAAAPEAAPELEEMGELLSQAA